MSKIIFLMLIVAVAGCAKKPIKPITLPDSTQVFITSCDGKKLNLDYCYSAAAKACPSGYEISDKQEVITETNITRTLYFKCK